MHNCDRIQYELGDKMKVAYKISTTLARINNTGIILRDFKSENLLLDKNLMPNIADFGAAARGGILEPWNTPQFTHGYSDPQYLNLESNMSWETRMKVAYKISTTLAKINNTGIILRDFKSENLLLDKNLMSNIADFGVAARGGIPESWNTSQFTHGYGDPQYLNLVNTSVICIIVTESNMSWETRMKVAYKISTTLARINNTGIILRDFKSENLLLDKNLMPNIADFGATARGRIPEPWNTHNLHMAIVTHNILIWNLMSNIADFGAAARGGIPEPWNMPQFTHGYCDPQYINLESNMSWETRMKVAYKISTTLARINITGIILRDFKSENLLLDKNLMPNIADFGAAARGGIPEPWNMPQFTRGYSDPQYLNLESNMSWETRMKVAYKISTTLARINNTGIILRDFKSKNLLLDKLILELLREGNPRAVEYATIYTWLL
ncbi:uncharacterized protein [Elaeis guineensis]|uniref:uncharacterized protein isoform X4 n=1 Tax=Elaeis guineensis var. tenera TaxID=51953 RepID=UPI003C6D7D98